MHTLLLVTLLVLMASAGAVPEEEGETCEMPRPSIHGLHGDRGNDGKDGEDGANGDAGDPGESVKGNTGRPGVQGPKGQKGLMGPTSENGAPGNKGVKGRQGDPGNVGSMSERGIQGDKGETGVVGSGGSHHVLPSSAFSVKTSITRKSKTGILKHDIDIANVKKQYSKQTGKFKCEHAGYYYFAFYVSVSGKNLTVFLKRNDKPILTVSDDHTQHSGSENMGGSIVQHLNKDDTVWLDIDSTNNGIFVDHARDNVFSGFLLYPD